MLRVNTFKLMTSDSDVSHGFIYITGGLLKVAETRGMVEGYNSFAAISSEVTANARMMLWEFIEIAGRENVYYCDTDSLLVNQSGYERCAGIMHKTELGKLKLVQRSSKVTLRNVKDYTIGDKTKIKGISKLAKKVSDSEYITYQQVGVRSGMRNRNVNTMTWRRVPKKLKRIYEKGVVKHDELVYPLIMTYSLDENWLDYEGMLARYGEYATYQGHYIADIINGSTCYPDYAEASPEDYSAGDRRQQVIDD
ncbi:unnamed protein product, partial [marine sediment metagenome]